jgi:hypothetical protein
MKNWFSLPLAALVVFISGCATKPQEPISLAADNPVKGVRVAIAMTELPKADTYFPGADCLLCLAAASVANSSLTTHTKTWTAEDLPMLKERAAVALRKRGAEVVLIDEPLKLAALPDATNKAPNLATKDFSSFKAKHSVDKLLVIEINQLGVERTYASYFPTSAPKAVLRGRGYLVNLATNAYEWYQSVSVLKSTDGNWDEPPKFPGVTNAYYQALELGKDGFVNPLGQ